MAAYKDITDQFGAEMDKTISQLITPGKGLLAADESTGTIGRRFEKCGIENTETNRQQYRNTLFTTDDEYANYISGIILFEETLYQKADNGKTFPQLLQEKGIVPGIKVDKSTKPIYGNSGEVVTQGHDNLDQRCQDFYKQGARFAKWRSVYYIDEKNGYPTEAAMRYNAEGLARYAAICQANGLVPTVEPEVMVREGSHDIDVAYKATKRVLGHVFQALVEHNVNLHRILLKPNMVLPGNDCPDKEECNKKVAQYTVACMQECVPPAVRGIMFLSGGQSEQEAAQNLNDINKVQGTKPWYLSYSYARGLQSTAMSEWGGKKENVEKAQKVFLERCRACSKASQGQL